MSKGEIIFAVMVGIQGLIFLIGAAFLITYLQKKSDKQLFIALILWAISPVFSIVGVFFGFLF